MLIPAMQLLASSVMVRRDDDRVVPLRERGAKWSSVI